MPRINVTISSSESWGLVTAMMRFVCIYIYRRNNNVQVMHRNEERSMRALDRVQEPYI